jgi:hypothetical protein
MIAGVVDILSQMFTQFNLIVGAETLRDYAIPSLERTSSDEIIWHLRNAGITTAAAASALVHYRLNMNLIAEAAKIGNDNDLYLNPCSVKVIILCLGQRVDSFCFLIYIIMLNKQLRTDNKGWSSSLGVGRGANNHSP